jgi:hypothetical protein
MSEGSVEFLVPGRSAMSEFARCLNTMTQGEIEELLSKGKSAREKSRVRDEADAGIKRSDRRKKKRGEKVQ